jgi:threonine/homoserine/homoserine lactone efflux protein
MSPTFTVFIAASLVLAVTPGPGVIFLVTRTLGRGREIGLASVAGVAIGNFGNASIASLGLAAIFAASTRAFLFVKLAGAAYLVLLGLRTLASPAPATPTASLRPASRSDAFRDGFLVALLNPKTALFFAAFLPQFIGSSGSPLARSVMLGGVFVLIAVCTDTIYVLAAGAIGPRIGNLLGVRSLGRYVAGTTFIALGLILALTGSNRPHALQGVR